MSYDPNKREEWWDLEVGQCRGCGAPVEEEHEPGCPEMQADLVDQAYERERDRQLMPRPKPSPNAVYGAPSEEEMEATFREHGLGGLESRAS